MEKLIKKFLTNKAARNGVELTLFVAAAMSAGIPWHGAE
jgi:hypothetical protein